MFIRKKIWKKGTSIQIVENTREWTKVKQKVLKYIWIKDNKDLLWIKDLIQAAEYIKYELEKWAQTDLIAFEITDTEEPKELTEKQTDTQANMVNIANLEEEQRIIKWISDIYWKSYEQMWFEEIFWKRQKTKKYANTLKEIVLARIASPKSKRASVEMLDKDYWVQINLQWVYDMMWNITEEKIEEIQEITYNYTKTILKEKINVLFMDGTTLYFESQVEDWFREKWYSKDGKFSETQVALTILVTESWLPIWYKLYSWKHYEWFSLKDLMEEIEKKHEVNKIILVADSGFLNKENTQYLEEKNKDYILWARIKNLPKKIKEIILDKTRYTPIRQDEKWEMLEWYLETEYNDKRLVVKYDKDRAQKDKKDREKNIEKLLKKEWKDMLELVPNFWVKKFIKQDTHSNIEIDNQKIAESELWDWLHWIITNNKENTPQEIWKYYRWLWQVEESFRINKHDLLIRPIFHWTERKIKAHIAISYMAFSLVRHLEYRLELNGYNYSPEVIRRELLRVQWSIIFDKTDVKRKWFLPSHISDIAKNIYKVMWKKWNHSTQKMS